MEADARLREKISGFLTTIKSPDSVYEFFKILNYPEKILLDSSFKRRLEEFEFNKEERSKIKNIYTVLNFEKNLVVFLVETTSLASSLIKHISKVFSENYENFLLVITPDYYTFYFVLPEFERVSVGKHKLKITKLFIQRDDPYYTAIEVLSNLYYEDGKTWRDVYRKWKEAFNVEKVTKKFFEDYKERFFRLRNNFIKQKLTRPQAHEFTLQFLNRIMFIYFVSKKRWLNNDIKFLRSYWRRYLYERKRSNVEKDSFYEKWLKPLFFKAFNNKQSEIHELPKDMKEMFFDFPYLNGGLFTENDLDKLEVKIEDALMEDIFEFFKKYNFTIKEDMPLELEVAVDPQMLGYVYESLANVAEEIYDRTDLGIFYTPRIEVDFMCRRSLVEYLSKNLPDDISKEKIYEFVFDEDKEKVERNFTEVNLWHKLEDVLDNLSLVDPACGSGSFLIGMMNVLYELYKVVYKNLKRNWRAFDLKNSIISRSLYGVDVMPWAVHAAELRLWLQLIIETEFSKEQLKERALLPNLNLNLRVGDSLVQEIAGVSLNLRSRDLSEQIKRKLLTLKEAKERYFYNVPTKFQKKEEFLEEEIRIFNEIIDERIQFLKKEIISLTEKIDNLKKTKQVDLLGRVSEIEQKRLIDEKEKLEKIVEKFLGEVSNLENIKRNLTHPEKKPFVWEIDFAEIFGEKGGFDVVIGNPPYVRQEKISPPNRSKAEVTLEDRRGYKEKLIKSVQAHFPVIKEMDKKSDYYIYFYFHGLNLLNEKGTFCFITSNSWLDVGYGKNLQEFLLKYTPIIAIYDNPKRSFAHADINTIIALFEAPIFKEDRISGLKIQGNNNWPMLNNTAKFVMFKKPFEEVLSAKNLIEIDNLKVEVKGKSITELVKNVKKTDDYRVFPITQEDLLEDGWEYPEDYKNGRFKAGSYEGNKWGGKYLRAPDIFYTILEKGKGKLVELGKIAKIRRGFTTGANEFFYLDEEAQKKWKIEKEFLKPVIKSPKECKSIIVNPKDLKYKIFMCHKPKSELKGTNALKYVEWGEKQKTEDGVLWCRVPSVLGRKLWYDLGIREAASFNFNYLINEIGETFVGHVFVSDNFHQIETIENISIFMNSTIFWLFQNVFGRKSFGGGLLKIQTFELEKMFTLLLNQKTFKIFNRPSVSIFTECGIDPSKPIREQEPKPLPDRAELDKIIFDKLGLTEQERKEVYWSVCELVKQRLEKARSLEKR